jgi:hypothetical protein
VVNHPACQNTREVITTSFKHRVASPIVAHPRVDHVPDLLILHVLDVDRQPNEIFGQGLHFVLAEVQAVVVFVLSFWVDASYSKDHIYTHMFY